MKKHLIALSLACAGLVGCQPQSVQDNSQPVKGDLASHLDVYYEVVSNLNNDCQFEGDCFDANLSLTLPFDSDINDWVIYFSNTKPIRYDSSSQFDIIHINGDLHKVVPTADFKGFKANKTVVIPFQGSGATVTKNDVMPNFIYKQAGKEPQIIASTVEQYLAESGMWALPHAGEFDKPEQWKRADNDSVPLATPQWLFAEYENQSASNVVDKNRIVPAIYEANWQDATVNVAAGLNVQFSLPEVASELFVKAGIGQNENGIKVTRSLVELPPEHYQLEITADSINIGASDEAGLYYALQSLTQLYDNVNKTLPLGQASDQPRYGFRGVHVDVARNYQDKAFLMRLIPQMGALKFNKLHLHLAEDEAWRLEIPGLPELTDIGAKRCFDLEDKTCLSPQLGAGIDPTSQVNGYLSAKDYVDVVKAAKQHHIEVIPSLDMPGHSRAAIQAMEARYARYMQQEQPDKANEFMLIDLEDTTVYSSIQYYNDNTINPCIESSYRFVDKVLQEIKHMHEQAGAPLQRYHIGADETAGAWVESPQCQALMEKEGIAEPAHLTAYFISRVTKMVNEMNVMAGAWSDGLSHVEPMRLGSRIQANLWETLHSGGQHQVHKMTNHGWDTVLSLPDVLYFDFPYMPHPEESGYYWGSRYTSTFQVFQFMPDNLPVHAEFWMNNMGNPYSSDDAQPLDEGRKVKGIQAQLWSETLRHESQVEYMLFPRLLAVAERAWHKPDWEVPYQAGIGYSNETNFFTDAMQQQQKQDWQEFKTAMVNKVLPKLEVNGQFYRIPPAGAVFRDGKLVANAPWKELTIEYSIDGGNSWLTYQQPVEIETGVEVDLRTYLPFSERRSQTHSLVAE